MQAEPGAVTAEALLSTLFSGPDNGGFTQREEMWRIYLKKEKEKTTQNGKIQPVECSEGCINPGRHRFLQREITQLVVSMWKPLRFIFLIEPPCCTYLLSGT